MRYTRLFQPITINGLTLENRLVMPALHHLYAVDGYATDRFKQYYWRRAEGGAGLIIVGGAAVDNYKGYPGMMDLSEDKYIPGYKEFVDGMHARGAKVAAQLMVTGRYGRAEYVYGDDSAIAPSAVYSKYTRQTPRAMTVGEIKTTIQKWAEAAARAREAGFDAVESTAGSGYIICQFLSPLTNLREDEYGGTWENRCRFAVELVEALRAKVGADYPLLMRVAGNDFMQGGCNNDDCVAFCKVMEAAGIDLFNITGGWHETMVPQLPGELPRGGFAYLSQALKDAVSVPVMVCNRFNDPLIAEKTLALGQADLIGTGRAMVADPDFPRKIKEGREDEIRHCVACNQGCLGRMFFDKPIECTVNGTAGREYLLTKKESVPAKKILVVGGGPGGCEFAVQAAQRGHRVTLWEKYGEIGGQLKLVAAPPAKGEFSTLSGYFKTMLKKTGVEVVLNHEATAEEIRSGGFDMVVLATGVAAKEIALPGSGGVQVCTAESILDGSEIAGQNVVVIGGGSVGCETASYLAHEGSISPEQLYFMMSWRSETMEKITGMLDSCRRNISIVDIAKMGTGFDPGCGWPVMADLKRLGVKQYPLTKIVDVSDGKVTMDTTDKKSGEVSTVSLPCDTIVVAIGSRPNDALYQTLSGSALPVYQIGDSARVGKILDAIRQADDLAMELC